MKKIDYSVIIRTTGNAHDKYQKLLDSIAQLEPQPKEVIIVLPTGYDYPTERLGWERFFFCPKGMVRQRLAGVEECKTDYALICDDDISFSRDFVSKLHEPIRDGLCSFSVAPLYSFLPKKGMNTFICILMASAVPTVFHKKTRYVSILKSTGYSYNRHLNSSPHYYETQSAAWTCFYANIWDMRKLGLDQERWLDANNYSALDDQTMFYKAWLMGLKTLVVSDAEYEHLDAKTSTRHNKTGVFYSRNYNRVVFWHRFIYLQQRSVLGKLLAQIAFLYRLLLGELWDYIAVLRRRMSKEEFKVSRKGIQDARKYIQSSDYHSLPPIERREKV